MISSIIFEVCAPRLLSGMTSFVIEGLCPASRSLVREGSFGAAGEALRHHLRTREVHGLHVVVLPPNSPRVTGEHVCELEDEIECPTCSLSIFWWRWPGPRTRSKRRSWPGSRGMRARLTQIAFCEHFFQLPVLARWVDSSRVTRPPGANPAHPAHRFRPDRIGLAEASRFRG